MKKTTTPLPTILGLTKTIIIIIGGLLIALVVILTIIILCLLRLRKPAAPARAWEPEVWTIPPERCPDCQIVTTMH